MKEVSAELASKSLGPGIIPAAERNRQLEATVVEKDIPRSARGIPAPLSYPQERLWFMEQLHPQSPLYNMTTAARMRGKLHPEALEKALNAVVARHDILHTRFFDVDGEAWQEVVEFRGFRLPIMDLSGQPDSERELRSQLEREARRPFNLGSDLMLRAILFRLAPEEHVLFLCMHHIASDAYSFSVFYIELARLYEGFVQGTAARLSELPVQYADYAAWQRQELTQESMQGHLDYWKQHLAGAPELLELPTDRPRPPMETFRGQKRTRLLPKDLAARLQKLGSRERVTPFMLLLAAFQVLLHRLSGQADIVVGVPNMGRHQIQTEALIGFFINTLVVRSSLSGNPNFLHFLKQVRATTLRAYTHQELPFEKLVEELRPDRNSRHAPLVQVLFVWQSMDGEGLTLPGLEITHAEVPTGTAKLDLVATMTKNGEDLSAEMEFNEDLFDAETVDRWLSYWETLLRCIAANPECPVKRLFLLPDAERERVLVEWNQTRRAYPQDASVSRLFETQAAKTPREIAIVEGKRQVTYRELNERANQLANHLKEAGLKPEQCVGIFLERSIEMVVAMLAVLKAEGVFVPLDLSYPRERLAFMLQDSAAPLLISEERCKWPNTGVVRTIYLDRDGEEIAKQGLRNLATAPKAASLAYVIYTSGSTGQPKGVCTTHRGITRLVVNTDYARLEPDDVVAQASNCSFDAATWEIWGALLNGARLAIIPGEVLLSPRDLQEALRARGITAMFLTTALFHQMAIESPEMFSELRHLLVGGESLDPRSAAEVRRKGAPRRLLNVYGPTETTTYATWYLIRDLPEGTTHVPIGRPIANTTIYVLDEFMQPVPIGVPGEVYIGGDGLARGYLNQPELTAARFVKDPFSSEPQARLYRTGDLGRWRLDGELECLGRVDQQVKVRGFRVEPAEIEGVLQQHPAVAQALVTTRLEGTGAKQLVGYIAPRTWPGPEMAEFQEFLRERLPEYMVPGLMVRLKELPLSANGKVDRAALPVPELQQGNGKAHREPRNETERRLRELWEDVLQTRPIGITDKFFALGGHSLMAMRLLARVEKVFGVKVPVATLFQYPTIEQLAAFLGCGRPLVTPKPNSIVEIQTNGSRPPLMLVHGVGGGMFWGYSNLARHLGPDQPVFAFKSRGQEGMKEFETIEEMAESYLADLREFQPRGPYYLGGYCFGGVVAYEMARRLEQEDETVGMVALINSVPPNSSYMRYRWSPTLACKFAANVWLRSVKALHAHPHKLMDYLRWRMRLIARRLRLSNRASQGDPAELCIDEFVDLSQYTDDQRRLWETHVQALMKHRPKPYAGRVTLFRSPVHLLFCSFDPQYGWGDLALGGVDVRIIPGMHETIMEEPNVRLLAKEIGKVTNKKSEASGVPQAAML